MKGSYLLLALLLLSASANAQTESIEKPKKTSVIDFGSGEGSLGEELVSQPQEAIRFEPLLSHRYRRVKVAAPPKLKDPMPPPIKRRGCGACSAVHAGDATLWLLGMLWFTRRKKRHRSGHAEVSWDQPAESREL